jgi:hypothetical protein
MSLTGWQSCIWGRSLRSPTGGPSSPARITPTLRCSLLPRRCPTRPRGPIASSCAETCRARSNHRPVADSTHDVPMPSTAADRKSRCYGRSGSRASSPPAISLRIRLFVESKSVQSLKAVTSTGARSVTSHCALTCRGSTLPKAGSPDAYNLATIVDARCRLGSPRTARLGHAPAAWPARLPLFSGRTTSLAPVLIDEGGKFLGLPRREGLLEKIQERGYSSA